MARFGLAKREKPVLIRRLSGGGGGGRRRRSRRRRRRREVEEEEEEEKKEEKGEEEEGQDRGANNRSFPHLRQPPPLQTIVDPSLVTNHRHVDSEC